MTMNETSNLLSVGYYFYGVGTLINFGATITSPARKARRSSKFVQFLFSLWCHHVRRWRSVHTAIALPVAKPAGQFGQAMQI